MLSTLRGVNRFAKFNMGLSTMSQYKFSATEAMQNNFSAYRQQYDQYVSEFTKNIEEIETKNKVSASKPVDSTYHHPYNNDHHPLNFSPVKTAEFFHDFIGPEQVSPHYENFLVSRKYLMSFWAGFFVLNIGTATVDLQWIMKSAFIPLIFWTSYLYFYMEGRKSFLKPLLVRFYRRAAANECHMFEAYYHENIENKLRELLRITKGQLDYWNIHKNFREVKSESINNFLANQYINLQHHINERAENILASAKQFEEVNRQQHVNKVLTDTLTVVDRTMADATQKAKVEEDIFNRALEGIANGQMVYGQDYLLSRVIEEFSQNVQKLTSLTPEQQRKLVELTKAQLEQIQAADESAKQAFLQQQPEGIDNTLKSLDHVAKQLNSWGK